MNNQTMGEAETVLEGVRAHLICSHGPRGNKGEDTPRRRSAAPFCRTQEAQWPPKSPHRGSYCTSGADSGWPGGYIIYAVGGKRDPHRETVFVGKK